MSISINAISRNFGTFKALDNINLEIPGGELVALLGPSGSGKTTLLRIIAGLEQADTGSISFHGEDTTDVHVRHRGVGFVFQHYALFKHMSVFENVAFGLRVRPKHLRPSDAEISRRVHELLELVQLDWVHDRYPSQLSGGQRQRIALARALAVEPKVLLLDEPFGALDAKVRAELRRWLRRLHDEIHVTSVFVTHDQEEALEVADKIVVMHNGKIEQIGSPQDVWDKPATPFVYNFLGNVNLFRGRLDEGKNFVDHATPVATDDVAPLPQDDSAPAIAFVRPYDLEIHRTLQSENDIPARVRFIHSAGIFVRVDMERRDGDEPLEAQISRETWQKLQLVPGDEVYVTRKNIHFFVGDYQI